MSNEHVDPRLVEAYAWADSHRELLVACFKRFENDGEWPLLEQLQHDFELAAVPDDVSMLSWQMPRPLGFAEQQRLILLARSLIYVSAAEQLLDDWYIALRFAYERWRDAPASLLTREDVAELLGDDRARTRAVSQLLLRESWPLGSGQGGPDDEWSRELHSGVRAVRSAESPTDIIAARDAIEFPPLRVEARPAAKTPMVDADSSQAVDRESGPALPPVLPALVGALSLVGLVLAIILAPAWAAGGAIAFVLAVGVLHRWVWKWRPRLWAVAVVVASTAVGVLLGSAISSTGPKKRTTRAPRAGSPVQRPAPPVLSPDAQASMCGAARAAGYDGDEGRSTLVSSPGQLTGGGLLVGRAMPKGAYSPVVQVTQGNQVELSVLLHDGAYNSVENVTLRAHLVPYGKVCFKIVANARSHTDEGANVDFGSVLIIGRERRLTAVEYVPGSTTLFNAQGKILTHLPDGVVTGGVRIPYVIQPGARNEFFVNFRMRAS